MKVQLYLQGSLFRVAGPNFKSKFQGFQGFSKIYFC